MPSQFIDVAVVDVGVLFTGGNGGRDSCPHCWQQDGSGGRRGDADRVGEGRNQIGRRKLLVVVWHHQPSEVL